MNTPASSLRYLPLAFFSVVMGLCGFSLALQRAGELFGFGFLPGYTVAWFALGVYGLLFAAYAIKLSRHSAEVLKELRHPVKLSFLPAISISLLLLGVAFNGIDGDFSRVLILMGLPLQLAATLFVISRWINLDHYEVHHANPAWFIPPVGNILVPVAVVPLGMVETGWFFFSIGVVFWLVLMTIVLYRMIFHAPLAEKLLPTYVILLAPPAVGFLGYMRLAGGLDGFAHVLFHFGLFIVLLLLTLLPRFVRLRFSLTWWAYSFPTAAFTLVSLTMFRLNGNLFFYGLSLVMFSFVCLLIPILVGLTLRGLMRGQILVED